LSYQKDERGVDPEEWRDIQKKIDSEYERKLKSVNDDAMKKLRNYEDEHKALMEKT